MLGLSGKLRRVPHPSNNGFFFRARRREWLWYGVIDPRIGNPANIEMTSWHGEDQWSDVFTPQKSQ